MAAEAFRIEISLNAKDNTDPGVSSAKGKMTAFDKVVDKTKQKLDNLTKNKRQIALSVVDKASSILANVGSVVNGLVGKAWSFAVTAIDKVTAPVKSMISTLGKLLSIGTAVSDVLGGMTVSDMLSAATTQNTVEKQLETVLANVSEADDAMDRLKAKASSLQQTTMYGDEVYLAGAAELATYLSDTDALEKAMDVLSDYAAGMSGGAEVSTEQMTEYATQLGKALNGTSASFGGLTKKGFAFSEAQEKILKSDTTSDLEKISVLADVIGESWDGLAEAFAETPTARITQFKNAWGDMKEVIGNKLYPSVGNFFKMLITKIPGVQSLLEDGADWLNGAFEDSIPSISDFMDTVFDKISDLKSTIADFTSGEDWANADIWGKMKIAWDKIVAEPFGEWWNSTGKAYITDKASSLGETLGSGLSTGLLALLGIEDSSVVEEGRSVGASFVEGFKSSFKGSEIWDAFKNWASNSTAAKAIGGYLAFEIITGLAGRLNNVKSLLGLGSKNGTGNLPGTGSLPSTGTVGRMTVSATTVTVNGGVVNVYGKSVSNASSAASKVATAAPAATSVGTSLVPALTAGGAGVGAAALGAGIPALTGGAAAGVPLLGAGAATMGGAAGLTGISKLLTLGASSWITGADGTLLSVTGGLGGALTNLGGVLGTTATTAAGSAAAGIGGSAGFLGSLLGLGSSFVDLYQGTKAINSGDNKTAKDEFVTAGTKSGMVLAGAGTGAAIGSVVPGLGTAIGGLIGAGIGGIGAFFGGDKAGKAISDSTDEGGKLSEMWGKTKSFFVDDVGNFFTKTIPEGWHQFGGDMKTFFTKTIPTGWGNFWGGVGNFFTSSVPNWWGGLKEKTSTFFTETIPNGWNDMWEGIGNFFIEDVPFAIGYAAGKATVFFTETVPEFFGNLFDNIGTFFTDTVPTWASGVWNDHIVPFFTESVPNFFGGLWDSVSSFFTDTVPTWASGVWNDHIVPFFTESVPSFFDGLWQTISSFFTDTVPSWASNVWNGHIVPFFTESVPNFFTNLWQQLETFFTSTIPSWVSNIWNGHIVPFFTESVPNFFTTLLNNIGNFFTSTLPSWASNIFNGHIVPFFTSTLPGFFSTLWSTVSSMVAGQVASWGAAIAGKISGWWSTISGWIDSIWSSISGAFSAGFSLGSGKGGGKHAWGGILNAPHMAMVAEDGAEAIIPLSHSKRERGLDLWKKSGEMLGVQPYSEGGIVGNTSGITASTAAESAGNTVSVNLTLNPSFVIQTNESTSSDDIVAVIRSNIRDMVDDIGDELAERLARSFSNMPIKGGA